MHHSLLKEYAYWCTCVLYQGVVQDFEVEGGNERSNQKMLLKKGKLLFKYSAMDTQSYNYSTWKGGGYPSFLPPYDTLCIEY